MLHRDQRGDASHLRADVDYAQELAVEYMDAHYGPRSGKFKSHEVASQSLNACLGTLINQIAESHHVPPKEVADFVGRRDLATDIAMAFPFLVLYGLLARMAAAKLHDRYPWEDGWILALVMIAFVSLVFGVAGMMVGQQWSMLMENLRVGNGHLSYRVDRLPWVRHQVDFLFLCIAIFWSVAITWFPAHRRVR